MANIEQPDWLKNHDQNNKAGRPDWKPGMKSPNTPGRPRGIVDKRTRVTQALKDDAHAVARVVIDAALGVDVQAAGLVLVRGSRPL